LKKNVVINIIEYGVSIFIMLLSSRLIISGLGVHSYSIYSGISIVISLSMLIDSGVSIITTRDAISNNGSIQVQNAYLTSALFVYFCLSCVFLSVFTLFIDDISEFLFSAGHANEASYDVIYLIPVIIVINIVTGCFYAKKVADDAWMNIGISNILGKLIALAFVIAAYYVTSIDPLMIIVIGLLFSSVMRFLLFICFSVSSGFRIEKVVFSHCISILSRMKYSFVATLSTAAIYYLDKILFTQKFGLLELGFLNFSFLIVNYIHGFYATIYKVYFVRLVDQELFFGTLEFNVGTILFFVFAILVSVFVYILWVPIVSIVINNEFALSTQYYSKYLLMLSSLRIFEIVLHYSLHAIKSVRILMIVTLISAVFGALFYDYFMVHFMKEGTIIAQMIMMSFYILTLLYFSTFKGMAKCTKTL